MSDPGNVTTPAALPRVGMGLANRITVTRGALAIALWTLLHVIDVHGGRFVHATGDSTTAFPVRDGGLWFLAFAVFVLAAGTDGLDGYFARKRHEVSVFGRIADPFVDKLLILGSMIFLLGLERIEPGMTWALPPWTVAVVFARELLVTALRGAVEAAGGDFSAGRSGKVKMVAQCLAIGGAILHGAGVAFVRCPLSSFAFDASPASPPQWCLSRLVSVAAALVTIASGVDYTIRALRALRSLPRGA